MLAPNPSQHLESQSVSQRNPSRFHQSVKRSLKSASGNPAGKPPGTRTAFSQGFIRDFALVWAEEGLEAVRKVAKKSPEAFVAIAARICPNDVRLTLEQAIPGGMSLEDYLLMREVIAAIREGLPDADQMQPCQVFQHVLGALRDLSEAC